MTQKETGLERYLEQITPCEQRAMEAAKKRWDSVAKPLGSLGMLEEDLIKIAGICGRERELGLKRAALAVFCADHGVTAEGVTQTGREVTRIVAENFTKDATSAAIMCRTAGIDVFPVDIGMDCETIGVKELKPFSLTDRKIAAGSKNIRFEPAMNVSQCRNAILSGIQIAGALKEQGYGLLLSGEMGIGNTTPSSALSCVLTGISPEEATGRGAGLSSGGLARKKEVVRDAVERFFSAHPEIGREHPVSGAEETLTLLSELGGFEIAGMTGLFLGGAVFHLPVILDGFISSVAALLAVSMKKEAADYMLASHVSMEPAGKRVLECLGFSAPLHCKMHLGEGSGAAALVPLLRMGEAVYEQMGTFEDIHVTPYEHYEGERETAQ